MNDAKMKSLIVDIDVLIYIHDIIYLTERNDSFHSSNTFKELHEHDIITVFKYLKHVILLTLTFIGMIILMKYVSFTTDIVKYLVIFSLSSFYGVSFVRSKSSFVLLRHQLKAKKAVQFALANYSYQEYVLFLDSYLSEISTKEFIKTT